jgi:eukaryotic-like serine/threonine-protein kinase
MKPKDQSVSNTPTVADAGHTQSQFSNGPPDEVIGQTIGRYKLLEKIGEGGCGVVYVAEQTQPIRRRVAFKVIKLGMDTKAVVARFEAERQALAMMDHPNIAKILDAGVIGEQKSEDRGQMSEGRGQKAKGSGQQSPTSDLRPPTSDLRPPTSDLSPPASDLRLPTSALCPLPSGPGHGRPFFVMELVRGIRITDYCDQINLPTQERLELFIQVCHAIQHAHQKGIIHRDIKPSNILVTLNDGVPVPKVIDFGIAKATEGKLTNTTVYTQLHQFIGTPAYMSPEQAEMSGLDVDTRSDIYSLGVLLYELLTGRTPFDAQELMAQGLDAMRKTIREREPMRPSTKLAALKGEEQMTTAKRRACEMPRLISMLKGDLDWIAMKCLEKDRTRRYETASGLAADIERYLAHEPVFARPPSAVYRVQKAIHRHRLAFAAGMVVVLALLVGALVSIWQAVIARRAQAEAELARAGEQKQLLMAQSALQQAQVERQRAERESQAATTAQREAERERDRARRNLYAADINLAHQAWLESNLGKVRRLLESLKPEVNSEDLRGWEWRFLWGLARSDTSREVARYAGGVFNLAWADHQEWVAVGLTGVEGLEQGSYLYELRSNRFLNQRLIATTGVAVNAFLPLSNRLLSNRENPGQGFGISVIDISTKQELTRLRTSNQVFSLRVARNGRWLASLDFGNKLRLWQTEGWVSLWEKSVKAGGGQVGRLEFLGDGSRLAVGQGDGKVVILATSTGDLIREFSAYTNGISALAYLPDSHLLATGECAAGGRWSSCRIKLWNLETGELTQELAGHLGWIAGLEVSPDGAWLASVSGDQTVRLWDTRTWTTGGILRGHEEEVHCLAFSGDGTQLVTGDREGSVRLWHVPSVERSSARRVLDEICYYFVISPDGKRLVTLGNDCVLWDLDTGEKLSTLDALRGLKVGLCFTPDGKQLLVGGPGSKLQWWDFNGKVMSELDSGLPITIGGISALPGTNLFLTSHSITTRSTRVRVWRFDDRQLMGEFMVSGEPINCVNFSPQVGAVSGHTDGSVTVWSWLVNPEKINFPAHWRRVTGVAFTPDASLLVTAGQEGLVKLWDGATRREIGRLKGHLRAVYALAMSPDGRRLATAGTAADAVKLWNLQAQHELITLNAEGAVFNHLVFSPDGNILIGLDNTRHVHIWHAPSWEEISAVEAKDKLEKA